MQLLMQPFSSIECPACKALDMKSPFQKLFSKPPDLSYLRVFGTACYPYLRPYCKNKLEPRHVIYDESVFPYKSVITSNKSSGQKTLLSTASSSASDDTSSPASVFPEHNPIDLARNDLEPGFEDPVNIVPVESVNQNANDILSILKLVLEFLLGTLLLNQQGLLDELAFFSGLSCAASIHEPIERKSYRAASEQKEWQEAMIEEVEALQSQETWVLVPKPIDRNIVGCKWVYKLKKNADGTISRLQEPGMRSSQVIYLLWGSKLLIQIQAYLSKNLLTSTDLLYAFCPSGQLFASQMKFAMDLIERAACQFLTAPSDVRYAHVKRIIRYLQGNLSHVSWQSKKQGSVSRSSTEAEYRALANTTSDLSCVRHVLCDLHVFVPQPPILSCDNFSSLGSNILTSLRKDCIALYL
ncbi:hypothetical protein ACLB2K_037012 [Fragaria x ananassa]